MTNNAPTTDRIDVAPLREAFEASGLMLSEVARRLGWFCTHSGARFPSTRRTPDTARLKRALGMQRCTSGAQPGHPGYYAHRIGYDLAARIAEAIGVDPVEVGL